MAGDGVQATDLKRVGKAVPKVYVHKDGKTIMIPAEKKDEYMAKGYKLSSLRAEGVMSSYGQYLDMEFKRQNKYKKSLTINDLHIQIALCGLGAEEVSIPLDLSLIHI